MNPYDAPGKGHAPPGSESRGRVLELARRSLMWLEVVIGGVALAAGIAGLVLGFLNGDRDPVHGGMYLIAGGVLLALFGALFLCGGLCLRSRRPVAWLGQLLPMSIGAWALWDVLTH